MRLLRFLTYVFINTFGITRPEPERMEQAARFIGLLLVVVLLVVAAVAIALRVVFHPS